MKLFYNRQNKFNNFFFLFFELEVSYFLTVIKHFYDEKKKVKLEENANINCNKLSLNGPSAPLDIKMFEVNAYNFMMIVMAALGRYI